jgi:outer membrane biosynthesis protein TonB
MRSGVVISAICHVVLVSGLMLSAPRRFHVPSETPVEVDLVRAEDIEAPKDEAKPEKKSENLWDLPGEKAAEAAAKPSEPPPVTPASPQQQAMSPESRPAPSSSEQAASSRPSPSPHSQSQPPATPAEQQAPAQPKTPPSVFDPANIPALMEIANASGFDAEATATANLSSGERDAFKAHLRKCWKLPAGSSPAPATRVVLRVYLKPDGMMVSEPVLIEASASRDGPVVFQTAINALKTCQPYAFLPGAKYDEWKSLDLTFTPRDMAGR